MGTEHKWCDAPPSNQKLSLSLSCLQNHSFHKNSVLTITYKNSVGKEKKKKPKPALHSDSDTVASPIALQPQFCLRNTLPSLTTHHSLCGFLHRIHPNPNPFLLLFQLHTSVQIECGVIMGLFRSSMPMCPTNGHCSQWAWEYMEFCLCSTKDAWSLTLGLISVVSWGIAEVPQIITSYREKSAEGLSIAFLMTWVLGDLFNLFGCLLEPATLPTQYYMAVLYTVTTLILTTQTIYYGHIYPRLKANRWHQKGPIPVQIGEADKLSKNEWGAKLVNSGTINSEGRHVSSSPIPLPSIHNGSPGKDLYYTSARSLTQSHTPTAGSCLAQKMTATSVPALSSIKEPLLSEHISTRHVPPANTRTMLCLVSAVTFLGFLNLRQFSNSRLNLVSEKSSHGLVMPVARRVLQVSGGLLQEHDIEGSGIGSFFGWGMAAIYLGGRLPQIFLNIRRGNVKGLNPLMFIFALVGNATYVASILVNSMDWSTIRPNLPWLVDAGGCVLLDSFIIIQFMYFNYRRPNDVESKCNFSGDW